jgi:hypothetical protein
MYANKAASASFGLADAFAFRTLTALYTAVKNQRPLLAGFWTEFLPWSMVEAGMFLLSHKQFNRK